VAGACRHGAAERGTHGRIAVRLRAGDSATLGSLAAYAIGFVEQPQFDALLWAADINFVRGEDSFVRAQWAQKPFVWHIYPQSDHAHLPKLDAALAHYASGLPDAARESVARFWHAWNGAGTPDWADFWRHRALLDARAAQWATELAAVGDLAGNLAAHAASHLDGNLPTELTKTAITQLK
jgi:uncharacterized repeat protein (TIGR03837 family)